MKLLKVRCDKPSFRTVTFNPGFNIIMADRTSDSSEKDTRNGVGKSMLIEIIHFCLGSSLTKSTLKTKELYDWTFSLELELLGVTITASRNTKDNRRVGISGDTSSWPIQPKTNRISGAQELNVKDWCLLLGHFAFGLPYQKGNEKMPSFRQLFSYFSRRGPDSYVDPFETHRKMNDSQKQLLNAFLLQLAWKYAVEWEELRSKRKAIKNLKSIAKAGHVKSMLGSLGRLNAEKIRMQTDIQASEERLASFAVHAEYEDVERQANELTREIHELSNSNVADSRLLSLYKESLSSEQEIELDEVAAVYEAAGLTFPKQVMRRLEDVGNFHAELLKNRAGFLASEIERLELSIAGRRSLIETKTAQRAGYMTILQTHGALAEYTKFQERHLELTDRLNEIVRRITTLKDIEEGESQIAIDEKQLRRKARTDLDDRSAAIEKAVQFFNSNSTTLYEAAGRLVVDLKDSGYSFGVEIERAGSEGISKMKVFCYDMVIMQLWADLSPNLGLMTHDTSLFDGVDERQVAHALKLAEKESRAKGFQYICAMNSDALPSADYLGDFDVDDFVRIRLTDKKDGCLLGIRF